MSTFIVVITPSSDALFRNTNKNTLNFYKGERLLCQVELKTVRHLNNSSSCQISVKNWQQ